MERVGRGVGGTITATFTLDGAGSPPSPNTATVTLTRDSDGTTVVSGAAATPGANGTFTYFVTPAQAGALDLLTASWTATVNGNVTTITTQVEVVGGFLFSIADARALPALANGTTYPDANIRAARTLAEQALEDACGVSFVPRYRREITSGNYQDTIMLQRPRPTLLRSITVTGVVLTAADLAQVVMLPTGALYRPALWGGMSYYGGAAIWGSQNVPGGGTGNVVVVYEHGYPTPPMRVARAALLLARRWLVDSPVDERTTQVTTEGGTISFMAAGGVGSFDLPEVVACVQQYGHIQGVA